MLVVGKFNRGQYLDQFPECAEPHAICIDPPPQLLDLEIAQSVYGGNVPSQISIFTTNHFGLELLEFDSDYRSLILLKRSGRKYVMPRYANIELIDGGGPDPIVPITSLDPIWWLPCAVYHLKEPIDFSSYGEIGRLGYSDSQVQENPDLFLVERSSVLPRYGIRLSRITAFMDTTQPELADFDCPTK